MTLLATNKFTGDGVTTQFEITFSGGYIDKAHVKAYIEDGTTFVRTPVTVTSGMFTGPFTINLGVSAPVGSSMVIYRDTPKEGPLVDFVGGSRVTEANLDKLAQQAVFIGAEASDATNAEAIATLQQSAALAQQSAQDAEDSAALTASLLSTKANTAAPTFTGGAEGGQINLQKPAVTALAGDVAVDLFLDRMRIFEQGGGNRGAYLDLLECTTVGTNKLYHQGFKPTADDVTFTQLGTGGVTQPIQRKAGEVVSVFDFMTPTQIAQATDGTFSVDLTASVQAALDSVAGSGDKLGGVVTVPNHAFIRVGNLTLKQGSVLTTERHIFADGLEFSSIKKYGGQLRTLPGTTITLQRGANLNGFTIIPAAITTTQYSAQIALWTDTAVTATHGSCVSNCIIGGYQKCIAANTASRFRAHNILMDGHNGLELSNSGDINSMSNLEAWPFMNQGGHVPADNARPGIAFNVRDFVDWSKWYNCFNYGYAIGFQLRNVNDTQLLNCGSDNLAGGNPGAIGFLVDGTSARSFLSGCQGAAQGQCAFRINTSANILTTLDQCTARAGQTNGIEILAGDARLVNNTLSQLPTGVLISNSASRVSAAMNRFYDVTQEYDVTVANPNINVHNDDYGNGPTDSRVLGVNHIAGTLTPVAASCVLPPNGDVFQVLGTANFGALGGGWKGREVILIFTDVLLLTHATAADFNMDFPSNQSYTTAAGDILRMYHDGVCWRVLSIHSAGFKLLGKTVTAAGTTGARTINHPTGTVNFAAGAASLVVTNSLVTANSIVIATVGSNDTTMKSASAVAAAGSFTLRGNATPTAETRVDFMVIN